jgi:hypothetical protein
MEVDVEVGDCVSVFKDVCFVTFSTTDFLASAELVTNIISGDNLIYQS